MSRRFVLTFLVAVSVLLATALPAAAAPNAQAASPALVRLVHAVTGAPAADFLIDGALAASQLGYAGYTAYLRLTAGDHLLTVRVAGATVAETNFGAVEGQALTLVAQGTPQTPEVIAFEDDLSPLALGKARLNATHAVAGAGVLDLILSDGSPILPGLAYGQSSGGIDVPANVYPLGVTPSGTSVDQTIRPAVDYALRAGMFYRLVILGGDPGVVMLEAPVNPAAESVWVRVAHAALNGPAVDVYAGETLLIPALEAGEMTQHFAIPLGLYQIALREVGAAATTEPLASTGLALDSLTLDGQARTVAAVPENGALSLYVYEDSAGALSEDSARINILNAIPGATLSATLNDGAVTPLGSNLAAPSASPAVEITPGLYDVAVSSDAGGEAVASAQALNGGVLYSVLVAGTPDQPTLIVGQMPINFRPGSVTATGATAPVAQATEEAQPLAEQVVVQPTPTTPPLLPVATTPPPATTGGTGLIGRVYNLNPGANLQLRQFPRTDALSLGLAPVGSILTVLGRAGEPAFPSTVDVQPPDDLDPTATWLKVSYTAPDGSAITAWAIAQFIEVTENGERVRLAELDWLPSDVPGTVTAGAISPTATAATQSEFYGMVANLNPGANLHVRRTPTTDGESLIRIPAGTTFEVVGILEDQSWTLIRYNPPEGGSILGWVSTSFIQFMFRGDEFLPSIPEDMEELFQRSLLVIVEPTIRGEISATAPAQTQTQPQAQPAGGAGQAASGAVATDLRNQVVATILLNPGANIHLRRTPNSGGESLGLIPSGATVLVAGRTPDSQWLRVSYDGIDGWISSQYVDLRLNGRRIELADVFEVTP